jgi:hypothetical protein
MYVVEDNIDQTGNGYNQTNYYHTGQYGTSHPYYQAGNPIVGYNHRHVVRQVFPSGNPWGESAIIPTNPVANSSYSKTYTFTLPAGWDENEVSVVPFLAYFNTASSEREIINAGTANLLSLVTSDIEINKDVESLDVFPNPSSSISNVKFNLSQNINTSIQVLDITGKVVFSENFGILSEGNQLIQINVSNLNSGLYFVRLQLGENQVTRRISVIK